MWTFLGACTLVVCQNDVRYFKACEETGQGDRHMHVGLSGGGGVFTRNLEKHCLRTEMATETLKQLRIKTNSVKRLHKEFNYYIAEKEKEVLRVDKFKTDGASASDIKQAVSTAQGIE